MTFKKNIRLVVLGGVMVLLNACATVPQDGGISNVQNLIDEHLGDSNQAVVINPAQRITVDDVDALLANPLNIADAERLSMQVNPMAKVSILRVGIAEADYAQAGRLENPGFAYERFSSQEYTSSLLFDIGGLVLMPLKRQVEARRLEMVRYDAAGAVLTHLAKTRRAWIDAVAKKQQTQLLARAVESAEAGNNMTRQMSALGHSGVIDAAESEIFLSGMRAALAKQRLTEGGAREALIRQLGLWGDQARALSLPDALPPLPGSLIEIESVEREAIENRLDVQIAKLNLESMAKNLKLTQSSPFLSAIELGPVTEKVDGVKERGYELEWRIPLFDAGGVKNKKARFLLEQAQAQAEATAIAAASNARSALASYRITWEIARHYGDEVLPLRQRVSQEQLLMYNGMLISVFDLLQDVREAMTVEAGYVEAVREFWIADTNLQQALTGADTQKMSFASASMPGTGSEGEGH